jgi:hypothetical protein
MSQECQSPYLMVNRVVYGARLLGLNTICFRPIAVVVADQEKPDTETGFASRR